MPWRRVEHERGLSVTTHRRMLCAAAILLALARPGAAADVAILKSSEVLAWRPTLEAMRRVAAGHSFTEYDLHGDRAEAERVLNALKGKPVTLVAMGPLAAQAAHEVLPNVPLVFCMVQDPAKVGLTPDGSSTWYLPRIVGLRRAMQLTLLNRELTADEARDWGILNDVVADDALVWSLESLAQQLADEGAGVATTAGLHAEGRAVEVTVPIDEAIIAYADELDAPLIVVGSRGRSSIGSKLLGDVAHDVVQRSDRPVFVVPSPRLANRLREELTTEAQSSTYPA